MTRIATKYGVPHTGFKPMKKTSKEWLDIVQSAMFIELDVNTEPCGWDLQNFNHSFHRELITLDEFKKRIKKSVVKCNVVEFNKYFK